MNIIELIQVSVYIRILLWLLGIVGTIFIIKLGIDYAAKRIGEEVAKKFNYKYIAEYIAYELTQGTYALSKEEAEEIEQQ